MKRIKLELSPESCEKALEELSDYKEQIEPRLIEVCKRLAEIGAETARQHLMLQDGNINATIEDPIPIDNGYKIVMSGEDVYFVEFGTGDQVDPHFDTQIPVAWGTWSAEHKQQLWNYGFWWYGGQQYKGTPAYRPLLYADIAMRQAMQRIVNEVFSK